MAQFFGGRSAVMVPVPRGVRAAAERALQLRGRGFQGAQETGWKRARQLATRRSIPVQDLRFVRNWFARHVVTSFPGYAAWAAAGCPVDDARWKRRRAIAAWLAWGGTPGLRWVNSAGVRALLNRVFGTDYRAFA